MTAIGAELAGGGLPPPPPPPQADIRVPKASETSKGKMVGFIVPPATFSIDAVPAARRSWGPSGSHPWLLGGSEDP